MGQPESFNAVRARRLTGCTNNQLRYWDKIGLVTPSLQGTGGRPGVQRKYAFSDLIVLRTIHSLLHTGISVQKVRAAFLYLRSQGLDDQITMGLESDGDHIWRKSEDQIIDLLKDGQLALFTKICVMAEETVSEVDQFSRNRQLFLRTVKYAQNELISAGPSRRRRTIA